MSKIEAFWENATADDVAEIIKTGELVSARFKGLVADDWQEYSLAGWKLRRSGARWIDFDGTPWNHCQVYREPSWYANKPDPGPGYRLLEKFPDEEPQLGDSVFCAGSEIWLELEAGFDPGQRHGLWYRRRIEAVEPKTKHYVLRVGDSVETPSGDRIKCIEPGVEQRHYKLRVTDTISTPNDQTITITAKGFEVTQ
jgi:hypothetical protein